MSPIKIIIQGHDENGVLKYKNFYTDAEYFTENLKDILIKFVPE